MQKSSQHPCATVLIIALAVVLAGSRGYTATNPVRFKAVAVRAA